MRGPAVVPVAAGGGEYSVRIGRGLIDLAGSLSAEAGLPRQCAIITDSNVGPLYAARIEAALRLAGFQSATLTIPAGEKSKSLEQAGRLCDSMIAAGLDRGAFVVALGGGVVGDLAGFTAAIYFRGLPFIQIPTTVMAQVDSSVGGKTGVNAPGGKNLIGAFHQPRLVIADITTLETLPEREFNEGFAEIIKHAIIRDSAMFDDLARFQRDDLEGLIRRNVEIKAAIVAADERETTGERALLNFGHTIGHAIENAAGYGSYLHGEAISLGLAAATALSVKKAGLAPASQNEILALLRRFKLPTQLPPDIATADIMAALATDKKFSGGQVRFVLTPRIGQAYVSSEVTRADIEGAIEQLRAG